MYLLFSKFYEMHAHLLNVIVDAHFNKWLLKMNETAETIKCVRQVHWNLCQQNESKFIIRLLDSVLIVLCLSDENCFMLHTLTNTVNTDNIIWIFINYLLNLIQHAVTQKTIGV